MVAKSIAKILLFMHKPTDYNTQQWSSTTELHSRANNKEAVRLSVHIWLNIINSLL